MAAVKMLKNCGRKLLFGFIPLYSLPHTIDCIVSPQKENILDLCLNVYQKLSRLAESLKSHSVLVTSFSVCGVNLLSGQEKYLDFLQKPFEVLEASIPNQGFSLSPNTSRISAKNLSFLMVTGFQF